MIGSIIYVDNRQRVLGKEKLYQHRTGCTLCVVFPTEKPDLALFYVTGPNLQCIFSALGTLPKKRLSANSDWQSKSLPIKLRSDILALAVRLATNPNQVLADWFALPSLPDLMTSYEAVNKQVGYSPVSGGLTLPIRGWIEHGEDDEF